MTFNPSDPEPVYYEAPAYVVNTPKGRVDLTMRDALRDMRSTPNAKK